MKENTNTYRFERHTAELGSSKVSQPAARKPVLQAVPVPRWTYACAVCDWTGNEPVLFAVDIGPFADCPTCGNECTSDGPSFEPEPG